MLGATQRVLIERERGTSSSLYGGDMAWIQVCPPGCERRPDGDVPAVRSKSRPDDRRGGLGVRRRSAWAASPPRATRLVADGHRTRSGLAVNKRPAQLVL